MTAVAQTVRRAPTKSPEAVRRAPTPQAAAAVPRYMMAGAVPVGALHDPEEHQAEKAATAVAAGGTAHAVLDPGARHDYPKLDTVRRSAGREGVRDDATLRRAPDGTTAPPPPSGAELAAASGGGPMSPTLRATMENRLGADFANVRLHTGEGAAKLSSRIGARAFAYGGDVFFGRDQFRPETTDGVHLIAHELTHTIQQGAAPRAPAPSTPTATPTPARRTPEPKLQRFSLPSFDPLGFVAEQANMLPGFRMLTLVIGFNPVDMQRVEWSVANVLRAVIEFMPGGGLITKALDQYGVIDKAANWLGEQVATLGITADSIKTALTQFISSLHIADIASPGDVWERAKRIFNDPIDRIKTFTRNVADGVVKFVKDAVLRPLADLASQTRAWDLLIAILGKNPITGDPVPQTAETLVGGFMKLAGQEEIWDNLKKANGVARAMAWFQKSKAALLAFVAEFPSVFLATLKSLGIGDLLDLPGALGKIRTGFGDFAGRFVSWAGTAAWDLLEIIFDVVSPGALAYIKKTGAALKSILKNPLPFVGNLVKAAKLGLSNFADNIGTHLKAGLIDWLTGSLPGVYIPQALSLVELGKFALSVLGITWAQIRAKIVKALGPKGETIMAALETTFDVVVALVRGGPAAAWELIKEKLTGLKDQVVSGIIGLVTDTIVKKAIPKLVSMFIPGAGFISAILSIYDTVMVFVEKLSKIAAVVKSFVDSIVAIAGGQIGGAASRVEGALAGLLSLAISFLAGFVGLGRVSDKIIGVLDKVRSTVDKGLDTATTWIVAKAKTVFGGLLDAGVSAVKNWWSLRKSFRGDDNENHSIYFTGSGAGAVLTVASTPTPAAAFLARIAPLATSPTEQAEHQLANKLLTAVSAKMTVLAGTIPAPSTAAAELNALLEKLSQPLGRLARLLAKPPAPGTMVFAVGDKLKVEDATAGLANTVVQVTSIDPPGPNNIVMVRFELTDKKLAKNTPTAISYDRIFAKWPNQWKKYTADLRQMYMGGTPDREGPIGRLVKSRMAAEGRYDAAADEVIHGLPPKRYPAKECDMSHIVDAVAWWNAVGRFASAAEVQTFMNDARNYELEPLGPNRSRGGQARARKVTYLPPVG